MDWNDCVGVLILNSDLVQSAWKCMSPRGGHSFYESLKKTKRLLDGKVPKTITHVLCRWTPGPLQLFYASELARNAAVIYNTTHWLRNPIGQFLGQNTQRTCPQLPQGLSQNIDCIFRVNHSTTNSKFRFVRVETFCESPFKVGEVNRTIQFTSQNIHTLQICTV